MTIALDAAEPLLGSQQPRSAPPLAQVAIAPALYPPRHRSRDADRRFALTITLAAAVGPIASSRLLKNSPFARFSQPARYTRGPAQGPDHRGCRLGGAPAKRRGFSRLTPKRAPSGRARRVFFKPC